jgi:hypothetical protein
MIVLRESWAYVAYICWERGFIRMLMSVPVPSFVGAYRGTHKEMEKLNMPDAW